MLPRAELQMTAKAAQVQLAHCRQALGRPVFAGLAAPVERAVQPRAVQARAVQARVAQFWPARGSPLALAHGLGLELARMAMQPRSQLLVLLGFDPNQQHEQYPAHAKYAAHP